MTADSTRDPAGTTRALAQPGPVSGWLGLPAPRAEAIAAMPEMLDLLKKVQLLIDAGFEIGVDGVHLRQVIDRAEGRTDT